MPNIADIIEVAQELESKAVLPLPERCVAVRNRHSSCTKCIDACLADAIEIKNNKLRFDHDACVGCGACTAVCPTEALIPMRPMDDDLERMLAAARAAIARAQGAGGEGEAPAGGPDAPAPGADVPAVVACARIAARKEGDPRRYAEVACLARVEEGVLMAQAAQGARDIVLVDGTCKTCKYRATSPGVDATVESANSLIAAQGGAARVRRASEFPACVLLEDSRGLLGASRRSFFTGATSWTVDAAGKTANWMIRKNLGVGGKAPSLRDMLRASDDGTLPQFEQRRRMRVLDAMDAIGASVVSEVKTRLFGTVSIDESVCNACGMCTVFCPTAALVKSDVKPGPNEDGTPGEGSYLEFSAADCVQCNLCADACLKKCIEVSDVVPTAELFDFEPRLVHLPKPGARPGILSSFKR